MTALGKLGSLSEEIVGRDPATLVRMVEHALEACRKSMEPDESLNDLAPTGSFADTLADEQACLDLLIKARTAAQKVVKRISESGSADPMLMAAMRMYPPPAGVDDARYADEMLEHYRRIVSGLPARKRGHPYRDALAAVAVRATMHYLSMNQLPFAGGFERLPRLGTRHSQRYRDDEVELSGAALVATEVCRAAGLEVDAAGVNGHMEAFVIELKSRGDDNTPHESDYMPESILDILSRGSQSTD